VPRTWPLPDPVAHRRSWPLMGGSQHASRSTRKGAKMAHRGARGVGQISFAEGAVHHETAAASAGSR